MVDLQKWCRRRGIVVYESPEGVVVSAGHGMRGGALSTFLPGIDIDSIRQRLHSALAGRQFRNKRDFVTAVMDACNDY